MPSTSAKPSTRTRRWAKASAWRRKWRMGAAALVYRCAKQYSEPGGDKRGVKMDELELTPLELIDRIAALVPPPRTHRHRYFGVLAPNSPLRAAAVAMAAPAQQAAVQTGQVATGEGAQIRNILDHIGVDPEPPHISAARGPPLWEDCGDAQMGEGVQTEPDRDLAAQPVPDFDADQRVNW